MLTSEDINRFAEEAGFGRAEKAEKEPRPPAEAATLSSMMTLPVRAFLRMGAKDDR